MKKNNLILFLSFFLSGISGLIYEILWSRHLSLIFGSTSYANTLILSTFMAGLSLGSLLIGNLADKIKNPLKLYFWLQAGIALFGCLTLPLLSLSKHVYLLLPLNPAQTIVVKFLIGALIILPATILMGGTFPVLVKYMVRLLAEREKPIARLYYVNNFGALIGIILAGFFLIYRFGINIPIYMAAAVNLLAANLILFLNETKNRESLPGETLPEDCAAFSDKIIRISLWGIFVSGFTAMLYEVTWIRLLSLVLGSSTYSFSLMLAAFISGITLGSFLLSKLTIKDKHAFLTFGLAELGIAFALILSLPFYERLPFLFVKLSGTFIRKPENFISYQSAQFLVAFLVMLLPAVFLGLTLPLAGKLASGKLKLLGKDTGAVFAFNSAGNIIGAGLTGLVLIPILGLKRTMDLGILLNVVLGIIIIVACDTFTKKSKGIISAGCCLVFIGYMVLVPGWDKAYFTAQVFRYAIAFEETGSFAVFSKAVKENKEILYYKDGSNGTVCVTKNQAGALSLFVNGKADASTGADMPTQILSGSIPLLLRPSSKDILVVGLGSGVTCGSILLHPIDRLDIVEISPEVVAANRYFADYNYHALENKKLHLFVEDAKTYLQRTKRKYDVIVSEPSNPWMSGLANLFSLEYFRDCRGRLNDDGIMVQWIQAYEMDDETFKVILKTFTTVFPEASLWNVGSTDMLLIGSIKKLSFDFSETEDRLAQKSISVDLARIKINDLFTLLSLQVASNASLLDAVEDEEMLNSDYFPYLEYRAPLALYTKDFVKDLLTRLDERLIPLENGGLLMRSYVDKNKTSEKNLANLYVYLSENPSIYNKNILRSLALKWRESDPLDKNSSFVFAQYNPASEDTALDVAQKMIRKDNRIEYLNLYAALSLERFFKLRSFLAPEVFSATIGNLKTCLDLSGFNKSRFCFLLGEVYLKNREYASAARYFAQAEDLIMAKEDIHKQGFEYKALMTQICLAYYKSGNTAKAAYYAKRALEFDPENPLAKKILSR